MPTLFQSIQGFAGASGVGVLCLAGLLLGASSFATNLPVVATDLLASSNWSAVAALPLIVVAYVIGLLAIALVDGVTRLTSSDISALSNGAVAARYGQLEQEAEILSGSVVGFLLLGVAALLNILMFPGWTRTLLFAAALCGVIAAGAFKMSRTKHAAASALAALAATTATVRGAGRDSQDTAWNLVWEEITTAEYLNGLMFVLGLATFILAAGRPPAVDIE
jgi:hypothetical protein